MKILLSITVVIRGLRLCNSSNIRYIFWNKPFKAFREHQMSKDKPTPLLTIKNLPLLSSFCQLYCHLFT